MADKGLYDILMVKHLTGELTPEEEFDLRKWLEEKDENRKELESLRFTLSLLSVSDALGKTDVDAEWRSLEKMLELDKAKVIFINNHLKQSPSSSQETFDHRRWFKRLLLGISVAASIILVIVLGGKMLVTPKGNLQQKIVATNVPEPVIMRYEENKLDHNITFLLNDGSGIVLNKKSDITFRKDFPVDRRDIVLNGKAQFTVAHDSKRPFTVYSGEISTTALGTKFTVTAFEDNPLIIVVLTEGKVVVKAVNKENPAFKKDFILLPGQQLIYNKLTKTVEVKMVKAAEVSKKASPEPEINKNRPEIPNNFRGSWFMFNNQPLAKIFESLEEMYDIKIIYSRKDVEKMYFIGRFNRSDSLQQILQRIATLNNLSINRDSESFIIRSEEK